MGKIVTVSVIIPTYNRSRQLLKAINSVNAQSYPVHEIIIVDDGSTDNTDLIIQHLASKIKSVIYKKISHTALPAVTRNVGIALATGDVIAFLDSDDYWNPMKLEIQIKRMNQSHSQVCATNANIIDNNHVYRSAFPSMPLHVTFADLVATNWIMCSSVVISRHLLVQVGYFPEEEIYKSYEDWVLWMRISTITNIDLINDALIFYTTNSTDSIRINQVPWEKINNQLISNIIPWGLKKIWIHPNKQLLLNSIFVVIWRNIWKQIRQK